MLNCVIYVVTDTGFEYLADKITKMKEQLEAAGVDFVVIRYEKETCKVPMKQDRLLVISDSPEAVKKMTAEGIYVTGFYHPQNNDEIFEGVSYAVTDVEELTVYSYEEVYRRLAGIPWDILETERLYVRESTVEDVTDFYRIYGEPSMTDYIEDLFPEPEEERAYMQDYIRQMYGFYGFGMWTVIEKSKGRIIGRAGLDVREGYDLPELGFVIEKSYQQKGYAKEVCSAVLAYAKDELLFDKVQALVEKENIGSVLLLKQLGFTYQRDVVERGTIYQLMIKFL